MRYMEEKMKIKYICLILLTPLLLISCFKQNNSDWVVKINKENITKDQIQNKFNNLPEQLKSQIPKDQQGQYVVNQLIQDEIIYQEAVKNTLNLNEEYQEYIKALTNQFEYQKKQGLIELFIKEKIDSSIKVSEQETLEAYEKNKNTIFNAYEERSLSHILVESKNEASKIYRQLQKGQSFKTLAKKKSIDKATAENNGKIPGTFTKQNLNPEFKEAAFNIKQKGNYTKPIKSNGGFHIFKLDNKQTVEAKKYDEVKEFIKNQIFMSKRNQEITSYIESIKDNYKIEQNENISDDQTDKNNPQNKTEKSG